MTKLIFVARKRPDLSDDAFVTYWRTIHAPLVAKLPGLCGYVVNPLIVAPTLNPPCDGIGEMWFATQATMQEALASEEGQHMVASVKQFCTAESGTVVVEEFIIVGRPSDVCRDA